MIVSHIVACSENQVIGVQGQLPWRLKGDLSFFKQTTMGHCLIMGRKTWESIGRALPGRKTIVVTRNRTFTLDVPHVAVVNSLEAALDLAEKERTDWGQEVFIVGGGEIYKESMPIVDRIYLTRVHETITGDTYYPPIDDKAFEMVSSESHRESLPYSFQLYARKT